MNPDHRQTCDLPPQGRYIASVRDTSRQCAERAGLLASPSAVDRLLDSPYLSASYGELSTSHGVALPLAFPNALAELNLISILSLLNFGASFRVPLHRATGRGAYDNVRALILALYLDDSHPSLLSAQGMQGIKKEKVAELLQVSIHEERPHPTLPAVVLGELKGPIYEFVRRITDVMNETGEILVEQHYGDLGSFVVEALQEAERVGRAKGEGPSADVVLERLVRVFPAFQDISLVNNQPVYIFKKALFLIHALTLRFSSLSPPPFPLPNAASSNLPIFADNVLPSMLVHLGVIPLASTSDAELREAFGTIDPGPLLNPPADVTPAPHAKISPRPGPTLTAEQVITLRAAAITAVDDVATRARERGMEMTAVGLDGWVWSAAKKRADWRALGRCVEEEPGVFF